MLRDELNPTEKELMKLGQMVVDIAALHRKAIQASRDARRYYSERDELKSALEQIIEGELELSTR